MTSDWKKIAEAKRDSILAAIPEEWKIEVPAPEEQKDVSGTYVKQFLSDEEYEITEADAVNIVEKASSGTWRSLDITRAFCHRAAIAHQLASR